MRKARRSLSIVDGLIWVDAELYGHGGVVLNQSLVLDTGTATTILSDELAKSLGLKQSKKSELYDAPQEQVKTRMALLPGIKVMGREEANRWVGCQVLQSRLHVPGILGLDFFLETDLRLAFLEKQIYLSW